MYTYAVGLCLEIEDVVRRAKKDLEREVRLCKKSSVCEQEVWDIEYASIKNNKKKTFYFPSMRQT